MTSFTPIFNLPYPDGSDAPCDGCTQLNSMSGAIFDTLDGLQDGIASQTNLDLVSVTWIGTPQQQSAIGVPPPIVFNTVEQDDLDAANLFADPVSIVLGNDPDLYGAYLAGFVITSNFGRGGLVDVTPSPGDRPFDVDVATSTFQIFDTNPSYAGSAVMEITQPTTLKARLFGSNCADPSTCIVEIYFARLWAVRLGRI